ncbi:GntR family transcriptional regulator [Lysinibacillus composti]|uniref:GntR family transcriptional regulator n=1 Tax=Lysinibacillus composti TaxID=720633 RepID=A0A3N9UDM4_9BACI|nr:GntR family transcriptional regulator [Lysinibacillus composti]MBM7608869.1 GntR family transcriptional regulator [Lysinibacillus composti]RQW74449.1 GntR family transcriptional regulator [Lysinibacillus composti]
MKSVLNEESGIPLYYQIKELIKEKIENGDWKSGDKIPNELDLAKNLDVSRSTIRQAILELVNEGVLKRKKGVGTFVAKPKFEGNFINFSYPEEFGTKHTPISMKEIEGTSAKLKALNLKNNEKVFEIIRLRYFNEEPAAIEKSYIPVNLVPGLLEKNLEGRLSDLILEQYGITLTRYKNYIEPVLLDSYEAKVLGIDQSQPTLKITRLLMTPQGTPVILNTSVFRGDRCKMLFSSE